MAWASLRGVLWAWLSSRLVLAGVAWVGQTMRAGLFPLYPQPDLLCAGSCGADAFVPWVVPSLGVLLGALGVTGLVEVLHGREAARWATWVWLCVPSALVFQFSAPLAWASGALLVACWQAAEGRLWASLPALVVAVVLLPGASAGALFAAAALRRARHRLWWAPVPVLLAAAALPAFGHGLERGALPLGLVAPVGLEVRGVMRLEFLEALVLLAVLGARGLGEGDARWLSLAAMPLVVLGAVLGVPWLGRLAATGPAWALVATELEHRPLLRHASLGILATFQGMLLHFEIHRVPVL